jgi:hypothetical protein
MLATDSLLSRINPVAEDACEFRSVRASQRRVSFSWISSLWRNEFRAAVLVFAGCYLGSVLGFALTFQKNPVSVLWPPNSILLAALLLAPVRTWYFLLLAALPAHWFSQTQSQVPPAIMLGARLRDLGVNRPVFHYGLRRPRRQARRSRPSRCFRFISSKPFTENN